MTKRSSVQALPPEVRSALDALLIENGFSNYTQLAQWLQEEGFEISRSAVYRYGSDFERRMGALRLATEQAKAIADVVGDDENALGDALVRLCQQKAFDVLMRLESSDIEDINLPQLSRAIADLNRASVAQKKYMAEVREKVAAKFKGLEGSAATNGLDPETLARVRTEIYGLL